MGEVAMTGLTGAEVERLLVKTRMDTARELLDRLVSFEELTRDEADDYLHAMEPKS